MKVVIIIPTYNEHDNTVKMIETLAGIVPKIPDHRVEVLYVDDSSPDGTAEVVKQAQSEYKWLYLLAGGKKAGLGMAYARGMQYAMTDMQADFLMEFDADFQHPPEMIPRLIAEIDHGYDYILGSRYIKGGSIPAEWSFNRKFLSVGGNFFARFALLMPQVHDVTGGFKLSRVKDFVDRFDFSTLLSRQFAYKIHLLAYMVNAGAKVKEVPFKFNNRSAGESKIMKNEMTETLRVIFMYQIRNPKIIRFVKFGTVGFIGYVVNASLLYLFTRFGWSSVAAWGVSTELAIISNFTWNNLWTFKDQKISGVKMLVSKFIQFNVASMGGLLIQITVGVLTDWLFKTPQYRQIVLPFTIAFLVLPYNYLMYTLVIWKKKQT
jgi:dolichol-phosphate mannosyltransferase